MLTISAGCSSAAGKTGRSPATNAAEGDMTVSFMYPSHRGDLERLSVWTHIEEKFGFILDPQPRSSNSYSEKLKAEAASDRMADVIVWTSFPSELVNHIRQGKFHDLTPYVEKSVNLRQLPAFILDNAKLEGRLYGIPRPRAQVDKAIMVRKDWLDALGLPIPSTTDDYARAASMFGQRDPDGNGKDDTYGFGAGEGLSYATELFLAFGAGNTWVVKSDGSLLASKISPGREQGLLWLRGLYEQRGIDASFPSLKKTKVYDRFIQGKTGMLIAPVSDYDEFQRKMKSHHPDAELIMLGPPVGPEGISGFSKQPGFYGRLLIPSRVPEEKVERIVEWLDWQAGEEAYTLRQHGLEGIHYTVSESGDIQALDKESLRAERHEELLPMTPYDPYIYVSIHASPEVQEKQREILDYIADKGIADPVGALVTESTLSVGSIYSRAMQRFETDFVRGKLPEDSFEGYKREWLAKGGKQVTEEMNEQFREQNP